MIQELDVVVLAKDFPQFQLMGGDTGTVVAVYANGKAFEVEFVTADGSTIAVLTLDVDNVRPMHNREILHVRELTPA